MSARDAILARLRAAAPGVAGHASAAVDTSVSDRAPVRRAVVVR